MLSFLPSPLLLIINLTVVSINSIIVATPIMLLAIVRLLLPFSFVQKTVDFLNLYLFKLWVAVNAVLFPLTNKLKIDREGIEIDDIKGSCLIFSNHLSWADIIMICHIYRGKIPVTKFFLKQSLIFIPFIGLACLGLGMPFLRRYSKAELLKNPKLATKDIETTKKACRSLVHTRSTLVNFCEGTRYTKDKALKAKSRYKHLMPPKAASIAVALGEIGYDLDCVYNTTLYYPENEGHAFIDLLKGRLTRVYVHIEKLKVDETLVGDYINDKKFKFDFSNALKQIWQEKDDRLDDYLNRLKTHNK
ncbi:acetyltransferase [Anaerobiospirillum thomasii]|uniref:Probable acyltransferase yihG n=1 Tax=Anaerobiospirillum thomasii TaxID=179995 RepID=A0A2X0WUV2_9GAMM|nr:acetyltransferase [Anaerobiospirillum thomasii]SPT69251.1 Probable acyltransferase yihG [Anaerobiospirillum thomasii]